MNSRKHIIFLLSDQHNPKVIRAYGDPYIRTPHLDHLAAGGIRFDACYCPSPLCVPSRMATLAGLLPSRIHVFDNAQSLAPHIPTFVHSLNVAGYQTVLCGRMHFVGPDQRHGFQQRLVGDWGSTLNGSRTDSASYNEVVDFSGMTREVVRHSGAGSSRVLRYDDAVRGAACDYLRSLSPAECPPQFLTVGFFGPHNPFIAPPDLFDYYNQILPEQKPFTGARHDYEKEFLERCNLDNLSPEDVRRSRAAYYGMVEKLDSDIGRILQTVDETLGLENCWVVYTSDHGEMMGERGHICKTWFYDASVRVPLIVHAPSIHSNGGHIASPVSLLDMGPTFIEIAGGPLLPQTDGTSWLPLLSGGADPDRKVVSQFATTVDGYVSGMVRWRRWKYIYYHGYPHPQLFDLQSDPDEIHDLGQSPDHVTLCETLKAELFRHWDPDAISRYAITSWKQTRLIAASNNALKVPDLELWRGHPTDNWLP